MSTIRVYTREQALEDIIRRFKRIVIQCDDAVHDVLWDDAEALVPEFKDTTNGTTSNLSTNKGQESI